MVGNFFRYDKYKLQPSSDKIEIDEYELQPSSDKIEIDEYELQPSSDKIGISSQWNDLKCNHLPKKHKIKKYKPVETSFSGAIIARGSEGGGYRLDLLTTMLHYITDFLQLITELQSVCSHE